MMKQLMIFDLDGTLIDSLPDIADAMNRALSDWGMAPRSLSEIKHFIGTGTQKLVERACDGSIPEGLLEAYRSHYDNNLLRRTTAYPGLSELLAGLKRSKLAVVTNKYQSAADRIIEELFPGVFQEVIGDGRFPRKPDPSAIYYLMEKYRLTPDQTVLIGDSRGDQATAKNAGIQFVGVAWGYDILTQAVDLDELTRQLSPDRLSRGEETI